MVTAIAIALSASAQKKWTLTECIDYALQNNITLQQAKLQKQSATEERKLWHQRTMDGMERKPKPVSSETRRG